MLQHWLESGYIVKDDIKFNEDPPRLSLQGKQCGALNNQYGSAALPLRTAIFNIKYYD